MLQKCVTRMQMVGYSAVSGELDKAKNPALKASRDDQRNFSGSR